MKKDVLPTGLHKLSGIDSYHRSEGGWDEYDGYYIVIDNIVYAFEIDPCDGYRSYGDIRIMDKMSINDIKNQFPAQDVFITFKETEDNSEDSYEDKKYYSIMDVHTGKVILEIGTNYTDSYYPMAIFHYIPENMAINQQSSNVIDTSDNNYTNDWVITSTGMSGDYQVDENIAYIYN